MAEDKTHEPVIENKENGIGSKETAKDPKGDVAIEEKADPNSLEEMQVDKDHEKGVGSVDEKLNESDNVEHKDGPEEEKTEKDEAVEKKDLVVEEGKNSDTAKKNDKATETVEKESESEYADAIKGKEAESEKPDVADGKQAELEKPDDVEGKRDESEKPDDIDGKQDAVLDSNGKAEDVQQSEKDVVEEKESKKSGKGKSATKKANEKLKDVQEPKTPAASSFSVDRPVRERKSVERFVAIIEGDSSREFHIEKGNGIALKDIPNVAYKLSRKKSDDTLKLLHGILFSRRGKAADIKQHICKFSGFVWHGDEEKQKLKIKEKLDKYNKEKLFEFCDILDITIASKATIKKDEVVTMLLEFLIAPHATTDKLLAEEEESSKGRKRKRTDKGTPGSGSAKSRKKAEISKTGDRTNSAEIEDESAEDTKEKEDGASDEAGNIPESKESAEELAKKSLSEEKPSEPDTQTDENSKSKKRKRTPKNKIDSGVKSTKSASDSKKTTSSTATESSEGKRKRTPSLKNSTPSAKETPPSIKKLKVDADKVTSPKSSSKKQKDEKSVKDKNVAATKEKSGKGVVSKGKEKTGEEITDERLREEACKILKEVDFNTATFTDILKILAERFKTDLTPRKSVIKVMIQEELTKLANEEDDDEEEEEEVKASTKDVAAPNDETHPTTNQV